MEDSHEIHRIPPFGERQQVAIELSPREQCVKEMMRSIYKLSDDTEHIVAGQKMYLKDSQVAGVIGINYENSNEPYTFFYPDSDIAASVPEGLSQQQTVDLMDTLYRSFPQKITPKMMSGGIFQHLDTDQLTNSDVQLMTSFAGKGDEDVSTVEVFSLVHKDKPMVAKITKGLGMGTASWAHDSVAEAVDIARLAHDLKRTDGKKICVPYAQGPMQLMPQYPPEHKGIVELRTLAETQLGVGVTANKFGVTVYAESIGNTIIDALQVNDDCPKFYDVQKKLKQAVNTNEVLNDTIT